jgi:hyperosmotically inducible protein
MAEPGGAAAVLWFLVRRTKEIRMTTASTFAKMTAAVLFPALALALAGSGRRDDKDGLRAAANAAAAPALPSAGDAAARAAHEAAEAARLAADAAREAAKNAADQATNKVADALITTSVHAELAKDPKLSSLRIDVDTDNGRVALRGSAPDEAAKERATQLASAVKGVVSVENQLTVEGTQG